MTLQRLRPADFRARLPELVELYLAAMRYPDGIQSARVALWDEHSRRDGFASVVAVDAAGAAHAVGYGYTGRPGQWWYTEVGRGLGEQGRGWLADFFELTELHVRPDSQGAGLGQAVLTALLSDRSEAAVLLSTPEGTNRAWRLYRRMGFGDLLRDYRFTGDPRPFGVLGRTLPLDAAGTQH
ncbi:acetyltransferase [Nakamurella endophytica]|uniref:Acetyltransferase n=1 Tax=Nakamurella endophytica TaxID=1748367 RepID=A0A917T5N0_9ACTN|nr:GNAT family N-acetyltransferase [Nakamurella endophytica]GGM11423.1 acetyltransferase [Nakamurella endophytica]